MTFLQLQRSSGDELSGTVNTTDFTGSAGEVTSSVAVSGRQAGDSVTLTFGAESVSGSFAGSTLLLGVSDSVFGFRTLRLHSGTAADYQAAVKQFEQYNRTPTEPPPSPS